MWTIWERENSQSMCVLGPQSEKKTKASTHAAGVNAEWVVVVSRNKTESSSTVNRRPEKIHIQITWFHVTCEHIAALPANGTVDNEWKKSKVRERGEEYKDWVKSLKKIMRQFEVTHTQILWIYRPINFFPFRFVVWLHLAIVTLPSAGPLRIRVAYDVIDDLRSNSYAHK